MGCHVLQRRIWPMYESPIRGRVIRPAVLPALHVFIHRLTPCSRSATILLVTRGEPQRGV